MEKSFEKGIVLDLKSLIDYSEGGVISRQLIKSAAGNITLFSFDKGEGLSEHTAPFDALVQILEGTAEMGKALFFLLMHLMPCLPLNGSRCYLP